MTEPKEHIAVLVQLEPEQPMASEPRLFEYIVVDNDGLTSDKWWAEDISHAIEQYRNAYPDDGIRAVFTRGFYEEWLGE